MIPFDGFRCAKPYEAILAIVNIVYISIDKYIYID